MTSLVQRTRPSAAVFRRIVDDVDRRLLVALLVVDGLFLAAHGAHVYTTRVLDRSRGYRFALDRDQGLAEIWQYGKYAVVVLVLVALAWRARSAVLGAWALAFTVLTLVATDDLARALMVMGAILVIVGIGGDLLHAAVDENDWANEIGRVVEDGGEMAVMSVIVATVWGMRRTIGAV